MAVSRFGYLADGGAVDQAVIADGGIRAVVMTYGAALCDLRFAEAHRSLVLGFDSLDGYTAAFAYYGAICGRYANRIGGSHLVIDGREIDVVPNEPTGHQLHGGPGGFSRRVWSLIDHSDTSVTMGLTSKDGDQGYPGRVEVVCRYRIEAPASLFIELSATTDAPTVVNLCQHSYFNLDGSDTILGHELMIPADSVTAVDDGKIPTGEIRAVEGTEWDFRRPRKIADPRTGTSANYDINFIVGHERLTEPRLAARLYSPKSGIAVEIESTEPGLQLYDGYLLDAPVPGYGGKRHSANAGCCLESQNFPDAPNQPGFPSAVLRPEQTYRQVTGFRLAGD